MSRDYPTHAHYCDASWRQPKIARRGHSPLELGTRREPGCDLYDGGPDHDKIPFDEISAFYTEYLK